MNGEKLHEVRVSAPGKVILHGEHAVVYGKAAIAVSLGLRTSIVIKEVHTSDEPSVTVHLPSVDLNETIDYKLITEWLFDPPSLHGISATFNSNYPESLDHEIHLQRVEECLGSMTRFESLSNVQQNSLRGFLYIFSGMLCSDFGSYDDVPSMDILMESELTVGAGTGSSASFAVCLAGALLRLRKVRYSDPSADFSAEEKKLISAWAYNCERIMHGSPSGIDNSTCTFGSLVSFRKGSEPRLLDLRLSLRVLLVDTRVSRETKAMAARVAALRQWNTAAVDCVMEACDHVTAAATEILESLSNSMEDADTQEQYQRLEKLWDMNHCLLASLGVSHESLEAVRRAAQARGFGSKLTGAGGGGYAIVLIPPSSVQAAVDNLSEELVSLGFRVTDTLLGGAGVRVDS